MDESKVAFDAKGSWRLTGDIKDMDVHREVVETDEGKQSQTPPPKKEPQVKKATTGGGFDLSKLRKQLDSTKLDTKEPDSAAPKEEKEEKPMEKEQVKGTPDTTVERSTPVQELAPVEDKELVKEVKGPATPADIEPNPMRIPRPGASLAELGLERDGDTLKPKEPKLEEKPKAAFNLDTLGTAKAVRPEDSKPEKVPEERDTPQEMDISSESSEPPQKVEEAPKAVPPQQKYAEHFDVVPAEEILTAPYGRGALKDASPDIVRWILRVSKEYVTRPSAVFTTPNYPGLRAYAIFYLGGRKGTACIGLGNGTKFTAVSYDSGKGCLVDMSSKLTVSGMCVMAGNTPLAITSLIESSNTVSL